MSKHKPLPIPDRLRVSAPFSARGLTAAIALICAGCFPNTGSQSTPSYSNSASMSFQVTGSAGSSLVVNANCAGARSLVYSYSSALTAPQTAEISCVNSVAQGNLAIQSGDQNQTFTVVVRARFGINLSPAIALTVSYIPYYSNWSFVDGGATTGLNYNTGQAALNSTFVSFNSKMYMTWYESNGANYQIRVAVYSGNDSAPAWSFVDGGGPNGINKNTAADAKNPELVVFNSELYAFWYENGVGQIRVAVYNGNDAAPAWAFVDGGGATGINKNTAKAADTTLNGAFILNSKLYLTWSEAANAGNVVQIRVVVYNGNDGAPVWTFVDGNGITGLNKDVTKAANASRFAIFNSNLYLTWYENNGAVTNVRVIEYNGNDGAPVWTFVDGNGVNGLNYDTTRNAIYSNLVATSTNLYLVWVEGAAGGAGEIRAMSYNGNDAAPSWKFIDGGGATGINQNTAAAATYAAAGVINGKLYAIWQENNVVNQVRVATYNGNDAAPVWKFSDGGGAYGLNKDPTQAGTIPFVGVFNSKLYSTWNETAGGKTQIRAAVANWGASF